MDHFRANPFGAPTVATEADALILVDESDREVGHLPKQLCHDGPGVLHRAFSLLIFNPLGELLLQRRAAGKRLWPLYWSNSCCSHPRHNEPMELAVHRRLHEELGIRCELTFLFKFRYQAQFEAAGSENELCSVFIGRHAGAVRPNREEIAEWRWVSPPALQAEMSGPLAHEFTPWFVLEWARIWQQHRRELAAMVHGDLTP